MAMAEVTTLLSARLDTLKQKCQKVYREISGFIRHRYKFPTIQTRLSNKYDIGNVFMYFLDFEERILKVEAENQAFEELTESDFDTIDVLKMYIRPEKIEEELKNMKTKIGI